MIDYAQSLILAIKSMGTKQSNPVLELLGKNTSVVLEKKYPEEKGYLGNADWRAFYHCHDSDGKPEEEHGHFHVFINAENKEDTSVWPHLACLSIDVFGQPIKWSTVNQWVTSGNWFSPGQLKESLSKCVINENMSLVERWLLSILHCYQDDINQLLQDRESYLEKLSLHKKRNELMKDRDVYVLSELTVDLESKLMDLLQKRDRPITGRSC